LSSRTRSAELILLLAVSLPFLFFGLGLSFLDPDEGLYAEVAREMLSRRDWVLPRFNGLPYLEKPPLHFWLTSLTFWLLGLSEQAVRLWSALPALGSVLLTWRMGRWLYGPRGGVFSALALATSVGYFLYVRKASTDFVFVFSLTLAIFGFLRDAVRGAQGPGRYLLSYLGVALAALSKGLIGVVFPLLILGLTRLAVGRPPVRELNLGRGLVLFLAVALPWHVFAAVESQEFLWFYFVDNQILRFLNLRTFLEDDVPVTPFGFLLVSFLWFFPWSVFLLARKGGAPSPAARWRPVVWIWTLVVVGFFFLSGSKLEYYALPAFPALALLVGGAWADGRDIRRWLTVALVGCVAVGAWAVIAGRGLTPAQAHAGLAELNVYYRILLNQGAPFPFESAEAFGRLLQQLGVTLLVGWPVATLLMFFGHRAWSFGVLVGIAGVIAFLVFQLLTLVETHHSSKLVAEAVAARAAENDLVAHEGSLEYSAALPYYTGRRIHVVNGQRGDLDFASRLPEARGYFLDTEGLRRQWAGDRQVFLVTQKPADRSVIRELPSGSVFVIGRYGSRWLFSNRIGGA
jgi:4-amino-4-deoxy-L-arabinose transferase-like glycosyltransferase